jgi:ribosome maturation factor RimP
MTTALTTDVQTELEAIAERCGCELIHTDHAGDTLRLVLDSEDGVTIEHCTKVSREASAMLDVCEFGAARYTLEVSSPGLDREFYRQQDYERFIGSRIKISWNDPETFNRRTDVGILATFRGGDDSFIEIEIGEDLLNIRMADIIKCRLDPEL